MRSLSQRINDIRKEFNAEDGRLVCHGIRIDVKSFLCIGHAVCEEDLEITGAESEISNAA